VDAKDLYAILVLSGVFLVGTFLLPESVIYYFLVLLLLSILVARWTDIEGLFRGVAETATERGQ
jgi:hypothetical protein